MHEASLVAELIEVAAARSGDARVTRLRVRHATTIPGDVVRQAFAMLAEGGPLAGAELRLEPFEIELRCPACGFAGHAGHDDLIGGSMAVCPGCRDVIALPSTAELELLEVVTAS